MAAKFEKPTQHETKYVTVFADARNDVDITFKDVFLAQSTDKYLCGIDELTVSSCALSMIEPRTDHELQLIRVVRKVYNGVANEWDHATMDEHITNAGTPYPGQQQTGFESCAISSQTVIRSVQDLMERLRVLASTVNQIFHAGFNAVAQVGNYTTKN